MGGSPTGPYYRLAPDQLAKGEPGGAVELESQRGRRDGTGGSDANVRTSESGGASIDTLLLGICT